MEAGESAGVRRCSSAATARASEECRSSLRAGGAAAAAAAAAAACSSGSSGGSSRRGCCKRRMLQAAAVAWAEAHQRQQAAAHEPAAAAVPAIPPGWSAAMASSTRRMPTHLYPPTYTHPPRPPARPAPRSSSWTCARTSRRSSAPWPACTTSRPRRSTPSSGPTARRRCAAGCGEVQGVGGRLHGQWVRRRRCSIGRRPDRRALNGGGGCRWLTRRCALNAAAAQAYVRLTPDYDALDVANKIGVI